MNNPFFEKPILNSPYESPLRHWELDEHGQPTQRIIDFRGYVDDLVQERLSVSCGAGLKIYVLSVSGAAAFYSAICIWDEISARCGTSSWASVVKTLVFWQLFILFVGLFFGSGLIFSDLVVYGGCRIADNPFPDDNGLAMAYIGTSLGIGLGLCVKWIARRYRTKVKAESMSGE